jgi:hypothetical protein
MIAISLLIIFLGTALAGYINGNTSTGKYFREQHEEFHRNQEKNLKP